MAQLDGLIGQAFFVPNDLNEASPTCYTPGHNSIDAVPIGGPSAVANCCGVMPEQ
jgi:hypothetical protein